ncbi:MAG: hypothetical protein F6K54_24885 [Okeania sp. SIO3B5]|uniref:hypothetical protein n=1 Tax=Okeania sp. SIO3B5 TaxID=2607811 RepID=UPI0013FE5149|nr:hypothetical protein [Okeania sp. SIO3B5]NEO56021.1 hypothetical protein [Okeania sp. SIO3B5]
MSISNPNFFCIEILAIENHCHLKRAYKLSVSRKDKETIALRYWQIAIASFYSTTQIG